MLVSAFFLVWALRGVDLGEVWRYAREARTLPLLAAVALATATFPLRIVRWQALLRQEDGTRLPTAPAWHAIAMGFMANNVFPLRAGELLRSFAITRLSRVSFSASLASVAVERVFDGLTLVGFILIGLTLGDLPAGVTLGDTPITELANRAALLSLGALVAALLVLALPRLAERVVRAVLPVPRLADKLVGVIEGIRLGFAALQSPARVTSAVVWSVIIWMVNSLSFWAAFHAFDIPVGVPGGMLLCGILAFGISLPSTPGYVGVFEGVIVLALALFAIGREQAFAYAAVYHVTTFIPITLLGLWSMARTRIGLGEARRGHGG